MAIELTDDDIEAPLTYGQLPVTPPYGVFLYCPECGEQYSATRGDYFLAPKDSEVTCRDDHEPTPMILAREERRIVPVKVSL